MSNEHLQPLLATLADHPTIEGNDIRVFIHLAKQLSWRDARELKLESVAPKGRSGQRIGRGAVANSLSRLVSAGFLIIADRKGFRGRSRYRLPRPPAQLLGTDEVGQNS